jgi:hypothetical protein
MALPVTNCALWRAQARSVDHSFLDRDLENGVASCPPSMPQPNRRNGHAGVATELQDGIPQLIDQGRPRVVCQSKEQLR